MRLEKGHLNAIQDPAFHFAMKNIIAIIDNWQNSSDHYRTGNIRQWCCIHFLILIIVLWLCKRMTLFLELHTDTFTDKGASCLPRKGERERERERASPDTSVVNVKIWEI